MPPLPISRYDATALLAVESDGWRSSRAATPHARLSATSPNPIRSGIRRSTSASIGLYGKKLPLCRSISSALGRHP